MRIVARRLTLAGALALSGAAAIACGGSTSQTSTDGGKDVHSADAGHDSGHDSGHDAHHPDSSKPHKDSGPPDAGPEGGLGIDCGSLPPTGTQLVATKDPVSLLGVTADNQALYYDTNTETLYAADLGGKGPKLVGASTAQTGTPWISGASILYLPAPADPADGLAPLSSWNAATGSHVISASVFAYDAYYYTYDVDSSGANVAYLASSDGLSAALTVSSFDGTKQTAIVSSIDLTNYACPPLIGWAGETLVATFCYTPGSSDAGTNAVIATFTGPSYAPVVLTVTLPAGGPFTLVDPTATQLLVTYPGLTLYPLAGGPGVTVDASGASAVFEANGDIVYTTTATALKRWSKMSGTSTTLVPTGLAYLLTISSDGNWVQGAQTMSMLGLSDLYLASTTTPGSAITLVPKPTAGAIGFSADSTYAAWGTNFPTTFGAAPFNFYASAVSSGTPALVSQSLSSPRFTTGTHVVVNDNITHITGTADIVSFDLKTPSTTKTLVSQADPNYLQAPSNELVYSWHCSADSKAGIWKIPAP